MSDLQIRKANKPINPNIAGQRFGRLVAGESVKRGSYWYVAVTCDCGTSKHVIHHHLVSGKTTSCGCLARETTSQRSKTHGESRLTPEHALWIRMKQRCGNPNHSHYSYYGARGITVCQEWLDSYEAFLAHVGRRPSEKHSLERIENNGNYEPGNVKWATKTEQMNNRRTNHFVEWKGQRLTIAQWSRAIGVPFSTIKTRLKRGWTVERTLTTSAL
jgi:hypothetical protein